MAAKKGSRSDLNAPLRSLSDRLRSLQREAGQLLEAARSDAAIDAEETRGSTGRVDFAAGFEAQLDRVAVSLLERWDIPTRDDLNAISERLEKIEKALAAPAKPRKSTKPAKKVARTSKSRRTRRPAKHQ